MKKLLKSEVCGTREQCTDALLMEKSKMLPLKKKKKKMKRDFKMNPNRYIYIYIYKLFKKLVIFSFFHKKNYD